MADQDRTREHLLPACREFARQTDLFDEAASRSLGIGRNDLRALNLLEHGPLSAATIANLLHLTRASITALVDRLEAERLVARKPAAHDRRVVLIELQPATWAAFAGIYKPLGQQVQAATSSLTTVERDALASALSTLSQVFDEATSRLDAEPTP